MSWSVLNRVHMGEPISKVGLELIFGIRPDNQLCQNATPGHVHQPSSGPETNPDEVPLPPCFKKRSYKRPPTPFRNPKKSPHCCCYPQLLAPCASLALPGSQLERPSSRPPPVPSPASLSEVKLVTMEHLGGHERSAVVPATCLTVASERCKRLPPFTLRAISLALRFHLTRLSNSLGILGETLSHLVFGGCRQDCFHAEAALFGMINRLLTASSGMGTPWATVRVPEPLELIPAQQCPSHLSGGTGGGGGTGTAAQHGCPDPNSAAVVFQCIWCQLTARVLRPTDCNSIVRLGATI